MIAKRTWFEELEDYAELDGTEWGDHMVAGLVFYEYETKYAPIDETLAPFIEKRLKSELKAIKEQTEIVEEEEMVTAPRKRRYLKRL